jgi:hypothetical protein
MKVANGIWCVKNGSGVDLDTLAEPEGRDAEGSGAKISKKLI